MTLRGGDKGSTLRLALLVALGLLTALPAATAHGATIAAASGATDSNNSGADADALCSIREAVQAMNQASLTAPTDLTDCANSSADPFGTNDRINLAAAGTYSLTIMGGGENLNQIGDLDLNPPNGLTIAGNAAMPPTIQGGMAFDDRILHSPNQTNLTLRDLIITGGKRTGSSAHGQLGGNVLWHGDDLDTLLLDNVDVTNGLVDTNTSGDAGGGIAVTGGGQLTIEDLSLIDNNAAGPVNDGSFQGGGIAVFGSGTDVTVSNSTVSDNSAGVGTMVDAPDIGLGGGIYLDTTGGGSVYTFTNATIDGNRAGGGGMNVTGRGGGIHVAGVATAPPFTFTGGSISNNTAGGIANGAIGDGGGLSLGNVGGNPTLTNVSVNGNKAGGDGGNGLGFGGGIKVDAPVAATDLTVMGGQVSGNQAGIGVGVAAAVGGGIQVSASPTAADSDLTLTGTHVDNNSSLQGGGILMQTDTGDLSVTDSTVSGNTASDGGGLWHQVSTSAMDTILRSTFGGNTGGGMRFEESGTVSITESTISNNATSAAGGNQGGGILTGSDLTLTNSTVYGNHANTMDGTGGGIRTRDFPMGAVGPPTLTLNHSTVANNTATGGDGQGGNLYLEGGMGKGQIRASIVAGGMATDPASSNCFQQAMGVITSNNFNLESTDPTQCSFGAANDLATASNLFLDALGTNGGPTQTVPLLAGSPAINRVTSGCVLMTDQRGAGFTRPQPAGGPCDSGAFEVQDSDGDGILDTSDNCPAQSGPASNGGCPVPVVAPPTTLTPAQPAENPECAALRAKLKKAKSKKKKRNIRAKLRKLGC